jgi:hypothetical protein
MLVVIWLIYYIALGQEEFIHHESDP